MAGILRNGFLLGSAAMGLLLPSTGFAQSTGNAIQLEEIVVDVENGEGTATGPVDGYVAKKTNTGSKTGTPIEEIPQSVSVVGRQQMNDLGAEKIDEALRYTTGVRAQPFGNDADTNWIFIRGFQATASGTYQDGLQNFSYAFGGFFIDSFSLERIEVLRGASSVLYGSSNPGGLVNYVSKRPTGERLRYVETGVNDAGTGYVGFDIGDKATDVVSYRVNGRIAGGNGYTDFQEGFRGTISPSLLWQPDAQTSLTILANYTYIDEIHGGGNWLPYIGTVVDAPFGRIDPDKNFTEPDLDLYLRKQAQIGYEFEHTFDNDWTVRQNLRYGYSDTHEINLFAFGYDGFSSVPVDPDNLLTRFNFEHDTQVGTFLVDNQLQGKIDTGSIEHTLLFGVDYKYFDFHEIQTDAVFPTMGTPISATDPVYGAPQPPRALFTKDIKRHQVGFYAQDQLRFGEGWLVTLNGRYDYVATDVVGTTSFDGTDGALSGRAGVAYEFDNGLTPYASVSTFFNPVMDMTATGELFSPESGLQYEVGVKYVPTGFDGLFTVALFDLTKQNVVTGSGPTISQIGEVNSRGIEFEAQANVTDDLRVLAAFTAFDLKITNDDTPALIGNTPWIVPEQQASLALVHTFRDNALDGVSIGGGVRYVGSSWVNNENTLKVPSVTLFDAKLGYEKDNWGVDLNVTNLFDKTFVASCQSTYSCFYGEGRAIKLKAHATW